jgi:hypothetical protein
MADVKFTIVYGYTPDLAPKFAVASDDETVQVYSRADREAMAALMTERLQQKLDRIKDNTKKSVSPRYSGDVDTFRALTSNFHGGVSNTDYFDSFEEAAAHAQEVFSGNATK